MRHGAGRRRGELLRQLLTESLLLVAAGGVLAWVFAADGDEALGHGRRLSRAWRRIRTVLLFTLGILVVAALLFGLAPFRVALAGGAALALKTSAATSSTDAGKSRTGKIIVALQMALVRGVAGGRRVC